MIKGYKMKKIKNAKSIGILILSYLLASQKLDASSMLGNDYKNTNKDNDIKPTLTTINPKLDMNLYLNNPLMKNVISSEIQDYQIQHIDLSQYYLGTAEDVIFEFETSGNKSYWKKDDLGYPSVSGYQLNLTPGYSYDGFITYLKNNAPEYYNTFETLGGTEAARKNSQAYIDTFKNLCEKDNVFFNHLTKFANEYIYGRNLQRAQKLYNFDISNRHPVVQGIVKTFIGNRNNNIFNVINRMYEKLATTQYKCTQDKVKSYMIYDLMDKGALNTIDDTTFAKLFETCIYEVLPEVLPTAPNAVRLISNNFKRTFNSIVYPNIEKPAITKDDVKKIEENNYTYFITSILKSLNLPSFYEPQMKSILNMSLEETNKIVANNKEEKDESIKNTLIKYIYAFIDKTASENNLKTLKELEKYGEFINVKSNKIKEDEYRLAKKDEDFNSGTYVGLLKRAMRYKENLVNLPHQKTKEEILLEQQRQLKNRKLLEQYGHFVKSRVKVYG